RLAFDDPDELIAILDPDALAAPERRAWTEAAADQLAVARDELERRPDPAREDPHQRLAELRSILFEEANASTWSDVVRFLDAWPDDDTLDVALDSLAGHLDAERERSPFALDGIGPHTLPAPRHWLAAALPDDHPTRKRALRSGRLDPDRLRQPRL